MPISDGSSITLLLRKRYAFWTDAPIDIVLRIAKNLHVDVKCDAFLALPEVNGMIDKTASPKRLLHVHHIRPYVPAYKGGVTS